MKANQRVLERLEKSGSRGITFNDFPTGFAIRSRISDLRQSGHDIRTIMQRKRRRDGSECRYARYVLMSRA